MFYYTEKKSGHKYSKIDAYIFDVQITPSSAEKKGRLLTTSTANGREINFSLFMAFQNFCKISVL